MAMDMNSTLAIPVTITSPVLSTANISAIRKRISDKNSMSLSSGFILNSSVILFTTFRKLTSLNSQQEPFYRYTKFESADTSMSRLEQSAGFPTTERGSKNYEEGYPEFPKFYLQKGLDTMVIEKSTPVKLLNHTRH
ncbi:unnamed protein product [Ceratitis capitata]|uniref:(Mediterranean fruit fly) hypothetical protein n=2 Tax=Ceratitis capitata TaxID=7213 RepID=A0A811UPS4_CERCA|nr:unnamed protein product [Ceratitis capitata]